MELTHAYMATLYQQMAAQHVAIAGLQDTVVRLTEEKARLVAEITKRDMATKSSIERDTAVQAPREE